MAPVDCTALAVICPAGRRNQSAPSVARTSRTLVATLGFVWRRSIAWWAGLGVWRAPRALMTTHARLCLALASVLGGGGCGGAPVGMGVWQLRALGEAGRHGWLVFYLISEGVLSPLIMPAMLPDMLDSATSGRAPADEHTTNIVTSIFTTGFNTGGIVGPLAGAVLVPQLASWRRQRAARGDRHAARAGCSSRPSRECEECASSGLLFATSHLPLVLLNFSFFFSSVYYGWPSERSSVTQTSQQ